MAGNGVNFPEKGKPSFSGKLTGGEFANVGTGR